ncbi:hypothetical protein [Limisalsivibrio acetivorans]|uniref:hypothetical protein n=1 Tax=Limisalsivibrio acetivorans TaxID=1304888 RepID=UPI0003B637B8|nr:hypothetical protein [Limisalsivibrio acetivorans]
MRIINSIALISLLFVMTACIGTTDYDDADTESGTTKLSDTASFHGTYELVSAFGYDTTVLESGGRMHIDLDNDTIVMDLRLNTVSFYYDQTNNWNVAYDTFNNFYAVGNQNVTNKYAVIVDDYHFELDYRIDYGSYPYDFNLDWQKVSDELK